MATDKTKIVNRALVKLGSRSAVNIDTDDTEEARVVLNLYDIALEEILSDTLWTFAKKRELLATLDEEVPFNVDDERLTVVYQRPAGALRIFHVSDTAALFYEEEDKILSDTAGLGIIFTFLNTDPATYKPYFVPAFSDLLAAHMAFPLLNSLSKTKEMYEIYEKISLPKAKAINAQTGTAKEINDNFWTNARFGGPNIKEYS